MQLNAYLNFNGNVEEVLEFYRSVLGGEIEIMRFEGTPVASSVPADWGNKVLHGTLRSPAGVLMASDATTDRVNNPGDNFALSLGSEDEAEADAAFAKLSAGGTVTMPFEKTFWGAKFGMVTDKYGTRWMVNCQLS
ncbi:MAG TPA: glyoxalase/bleomycin resistance/extradiol dioxygenase family protein [Xanthomonadales bacterium]|nr:glyoxalase/bleomycin resistance/extradiol dioxygenase family protein [Xanthomonadales bacterium]